MKSVYIVDGLRSHIGKVNGVYKNLTAEKLGAAVLKELISRYSVLQVDMIVAGNAVGTGGNITRLMALYAGIGENIPAITIDSQCSSGLSSIQIAQSLISQGIAQCVIAGGFESVSTQPIRSYHFNDSRYKEGYSQYDCAQFSPEENSDTAMLDGAKRVAEKWHFSKTHLDTIALASHQKASSDKVRALVQKCIFPIDGSTYDESIRHNITAALLDKTPPISGVISAGNSSSKNDGAAFVILCSEEYAYKAKLTPRAAILLGVMAANNPLYSPECAIIAAKKLLTQANLSFKDIHCFEFNEAFAVINALFIQEYPHLTHLLNPLGGALAYGHPYAASGTIILLHLLESLQSNQYGVCSIAAAGSQGSALLVRKMKGGF